MLWITLVVLAVAAWFLIRYMKKSSSGQDSGATHQIESPPSPASQSANPPSSTTTPGNTANAPAATGATDALAARYGVASGDTLHDIRETLKILNLRVSDAARLGIEQDTFSALAQGTDGGLAGDRLDEINRRLRAMLS